MKAKQMCMTCQDREIFRYKWVDLAEDNIVKPRACTSKEHKLEWVALNWNGTTIPIDHDESEDWLEIGRMVATYCNGIDQELFEAIAYEHALERDSVSETLDKLENLRHEDFTVYSNKEEAAREMWREQYHIDNYSDLFDYIDWSKVEEDFENIFCMKTFEDNDLVVWDD